MCLASVLHAVHETSASDEPRKAGGSAAPTSVQGDLDVTCTRDRAGLRRPEPLNIFHMLRLIKEAAKYGFVLHS
jgi:hypothetical protein